MYTAGSQDDEEQLGSIFSSIGKAIGGVIKAGEAALGVGGGGDKKISISLDPGRPVTASIVPKSNPLEDAAQNALAAAQRAAGGVPTWVWIAGAAAGALLLVNTMGARRRR